MPKKAKVHEDYRCPVCTRPKFFMKNEDFIYFDIHKKPVCRSCATRLTNLTEKRKEPISSLYHRSKELTGLGFNDFKKKIFKATIDEFKQKLNASEEKREKMINEQRKFTWETREEVINSWKKAINGYTSLLKELENKK